MVIGHTFQMGTALCGFEPGGSAACQTVDDRLRSASETARSEAESCEGSIKVPPHWKGHIKQRFSRQVKSEINAPKEFYGGSGSAA